MWCEASGRGYDLLGEWVSLFSLRSLIPTLTSSRLPDSDSSRLSIIRSIISISHKISLIYSSLPTHHSLFGYPFPYILSLLISSFSGVFLLIWISSMILSSLILSRPNFLPSVLFSLSNWRLRRLSRTSLIRELITRESGRIPSYQRWEFFQNASNVRAQNWGWFRCWEEGNLE